MKRKNAILLQQAFLKRTGLSESYDIVKSHGGELKVETKEGEGTLFCIVLPI